jgi:hypothetical protein
MRQKMLKRLAFAMMTSGFMLNAYAIGAGAYLGIMTGPATNTGSDTQAQVQGSSATVTASPRSNQWGTRAFLGYNFNEYAAIESGFTYFSSIHYSTKGNAQTCSGLSSRVRDIDLVGKGMIPIMDSFDVYGKGGVAATYYTTSGAFNQPPPGSTCGKNVYETKFRPTISLGGSYYLSQSWVADLSWTRVMVGSIIKNVDFYALGISYHFVNRYCGQFLCDD